MQLDLDGFLRLVGFFQQNVRYGNEKTIHSQQREGFYVTGWCQDNREDWGHAVIEFFFQGLLRKIRLWLWISGYKIKRLKWTIKCSSVVWITAAVLKREIVFYSFTLRISHFSSKGIAVALWTANTWVLTCKGAEVLASCDHLWIQRLSGLSFLRGGLAALWLSELSEPSTYGRDMQGNILKEPPWSLKTKRHVIRLRHAGRRSGIGSCAAIRPTNRGPVIRKGEEHDCFQWRNINKVPFNAEFLSSRVWNLGSTCEVTLNL